jgi:endonuclease IV
MQNFAWDVAKIGGNAAPNHDLSYMSPKICETPNSHQKKKSMVIMKKRRRQSADPSN